MKDYPMNIQKEWSSFRLTLLLYAIIFIIPLTFYFVYISFNTLDSDTKVIRQAGWLEGTTMSLSVNPSNKKNQQTVKRVDETLQKLSVWVTQNNDSEFYIGGQTLTKDLSDVMTYWNLQKHALLNNDMETNFKENNLKCYDAVRNLTVIIENMVYLKQNKLINMFYWNLATAMMLALLLIYMVRTYIHKQIKKHAIHDYETNLFNKQYFLSELKTSCARSARHNYPLSMLSIFINDFETESYDKKTKEHILKVLGGLVTSLTRTSDVACRYDKDQFSILLTDTEEENALFLEGRIRESLEKHNFNVSPQLNFKFSTIYFNMDETSEAFVSRSQNLLK